MKKLRMPKMRNAIPTSEKAPYKHIVSTVKPKQSESGENEQNWHHCDHQTTIGGGGGN